MNWGTMVAVVDETRVETLTLRAVLDERPVSASTALLRRAEQLAVGLDLPDLVADVPGFRP